MMLRCLFCNKFTLFFGRHVEKNHIYERRKLHGLLTTAWNVIKDDLREIIPDIDTKIGRKKE